MNITLIDPKQVSDPELLAMLMAFYSRSTKPIHERLASLGDTEDQIKTALKKYYIGYGHASIADCASVSVFLENISLLAAKRVEATPLFNGQECSTRYIDFSKQGLTDPLDTELSRQILKGWMFLYYELQEPIKEHLISLNPCPSTESEALWTKAIQAKVFDVVRSFLPVAIQTSVALSMPMRALQEHLANLALSKEDEFKELAKTTLYQLATRFPSAFESTTPKVSKFYKETHQLQDYTLEYSKSRIPQPLTVTTSLDPELFRYTEELSLRQKGEKLPNFFNALGTVKIDYALDYGSWRDIQRHRNTVYNGASHLTSLWKFSEDYLRCIPNTIISSVRFKLEQQYRDLATLFYEYPDISKIQYYLPLGNLVNARLVVTIPQLIYILELRSSPTVHFTLRKLIHEIYQQLGSYSSLLNIQADLTPEQFSLARGYQDIHEKY